MLNLGITSVVGLGEIVENKRAEKEELLYKKK
jgi:hypothetical protein